MEGAKRSFGTLSGVLAVLLALALSIAGAAFADTTAVADSVTAGKLVIYKYDAETRGGTPQGGGSLQGTEFALTNKSNNAIVFKDVYGHDLEVAVNQSIIIGSLTDNQEKDFAHWDGNVLSTAVNALPIGKYHIQEVTPPDGYALAGDEHLYTTGYDTYNKDSVWRTTGYDFEIKTANQVVTFTGDGNTAVQTTGTSNYTAGPGCYDPNLRGGVGLHKHDADYPTAIGQSQGNATLKGGAFLVYNNTGKTVQVWRGFDDNTKKGIPAEKQTLTLADGTKYSTDVDASGNVAQGECVAILITGANGGAETFSAALPWGDYQIEEVVAPGAVWSTEVSGTDPDTSHVTGYTQVKGSSSVYKPTSKAKRGVAVKSNGLYDVSWSESMTNRVLRGSVGLQKVDYDFGLTTGSGSAIAYSQGDGRLGTTNESNTPAEIEIYNVSEYNEQHRPVYIYRQSNDLDGISGEVAWGEKVARVKTNANGYVKLSGLPYGSYYAVEVKPSTGYLLNEDWKFYFDITGEDVSTTPNATNVTEDGSELLTEKVIRANADLAKIDMETRGHKPLGAATLEGAVFAVQNISDGGESGGGSNAKGAGDKPVSNGTVEWNGVRYAKNAYLTKSLATDSEGRASLEGLPYGRYLITEVSAPTGYVRNGSWSQTLTVREDGKTYDITEYNASPDNANGTYTALDDLVLREDILFQKLKTEDQKPMEKVAFKLTSKTTGEWHILVTDEDGMLDTSAWMRQDRHHYPGTPDEQWRMHTQDTNKSDAAYDPGTNTVDDSLLTYNQGYWFAGFVGAGAGQGADAISTALGNLGETAVNQRSALPYDTYELQELRCAANEGRDLVLRNIVIGRSDNDVEDIGTINNPNYSFEGEDVVAPAGLSVYAHKTASPAPNEKVDQNDEITYTVELENTADTATGTVLVRDYVPDGTTYVSAEDGGVYVPANRSSNGKAYVEWAAGPLDGTTGKGSVSYKVKVDLNPPSVIVNQARYAVYEPDEEAPSAGDASTRVPAGATNVVRHRTDGTKLPANVTAKKVKASGADGEPVHIGENVTYTVTLANEGVADAYNVGVFDMVPYGTEIAKVNDGHDYEVADITAGGKMVGTYGVAWKVDKLAAGESKSLSFTVTVTDNVYFTVENQATFGTVSGDVTGPLANSTNIVVTTVEKLPELTVELTSDPEMDGESPAKVAPGDYVSYTVTVLNSGYGNAYDVPVYVSIPTGTRYVAGSVSTDYAGQEATQEDPYVKWTVPYIVHNGGEVSGMTFQVRVNDGLVGGTLIDAIASIGGESPVKEGELSTHDVGDTAISNITTHEVVAASMSTEKTADPASGEDVSPGQEITYTVTATNDGEYNANYFAIRDAIPANTTFVDGSIEVTDAHGKSSDDEPEDDGSGEGGGSGATEPAEEEEPVVWSPISVQQDAEGVYRAVVTRPSTQTFVNYDDVREWLQTARFGKTIEFTVTDTADYDRLWKAEVIADGRILLSVRIIVPSKADSPNYVESGSGAYGNYDAESGAVYAVFDRVAPGETVHVKFKVRVNDGVPGDTIITNGYTFASGVTSPPGRELDNRGPDETGHRVGTPELTGTKEVLNAAGQDIDGTYVQAGDVVTYKVSVSNVGTASATKVAIYDAVPDGMAYVEESYVLLDAEGNPMEDTRDHAGNASTKTMTAAADIVAQGSALTMRFDAVVKDGVEPGTVVSNSASYAEHVESTPTSPLPDSTEPVTLTVDAPQLDLEKSAVPASGADIAAGDTIAYALSLTNGSHVPARGAAVYDTLPDGASYVAGTADGLDAVGPDDAPTAFSKSQITVEPGETKTFGFSVVVDKATEPGTEVTNTAVAGFSDVASPALDADSSSTTHNVVAPQITLAKASDPADGSYVSAGDEISYTITATNDGPVNAYDVAVYDDLPDGLTYVPESMSVTPQGTGSVTDSGAVSVLVGDMPKDGQPVVIKFKASVDLGYKGDLANTASWGAGITETPTAPFADAVSNDDVIHVVEPVVELVKSSDPVDGSYVEPGQVVTYTLRATNVGHVNANRVAVHDVLPEGVTYVDGSMAVDGALASVSDSTVAATMALKVGESKDIVFKAIVDEGYSGEIVNTASWGNVDDTWTPSAPLPNMSNEDLVRSEGPSIELVKSADVPDGSYVAPGAEVTYTITATNKGHRDLNATVTDTLPAGLTYVEGSATGGAVYEDGTLTFRTGELAGGADPVSFTFKATVDEDQAGNDITNIARWVDPEQGFEGMANNHLLKVGWADIELVKASDPADGTAVSAGSTVTYTMKASNKGTARSRNFAMEDPIPEHTTYVAGSARLSDDSGKAVDGVSEGDLTVKDADGKVAKVVYVRGADLVAGESTPTLSFSVTVDEGYSGNVSNTARWASDVTEKPASGDNIKDGKPESGDSNGTDSASTAVAEPRLSVEKTADSQYFSEGDEIVYTIAVTNSGDAEARGVTVQDLLGDGLKVVSTDPKGAVAGKSSSDKAKASAQSNTAGWAGKWVARTLFSFDGGKVATVDDGAYTAKPYIVLEADGSGYVFAYKDTRRDGKWSHTSDTKGTYVDGGSAAESSLKRNGDTLTLKSGSTSIVFDREAEVQATASSAATFGAHGGGYYVGEAGRKYADGNAVAFPLAPGTYRLSVEGGSPYTATINVDERDEDGYSTNDMQGYSVSDGNPVSSFVVPERAIISVVLQKEGNSALIFDDAVKPVIAQDAASSSGQAPSASASSSSASSASSASSSSSLVAAGNAKSAASPSTATADTTPYQVKWSTNVPAGETVTFKLTAEVTDDAGDEVTNIADVYLADGGDPVATSSATSKKAKGAQKAASDAVKAVQAAASSMPQLGRAAAVGFVIVGSIGSLGAGGYMFWRNRRRDIGRK